MAGDTKLTTDHRTIRTWAESRGGKPVTVKSTEKNGEPGVLRIDFPGYSGGDRFEEISWDAFFQKFDENNLAFLYQEHTAGGEESRFFKLVSKDSAEHKSHDSQHKTEDSSATAHKHKEDEKTSKAEHKTGASSHKDDKAHKAEHESNSSSSKTEHKKDEKSHKSEEKGHKATHK